MTYTRYANDIRREENINFNNAETDVFLLLPGDQKNDCDFVQDAGFNGCGNNSYLLDGWLVHSRLY